MCKSFIKKKLTVPAYKKIVSLGNKPFLFYFYLFCRLTINFYLKIVYIKFKKKHNR